MHLDSAICYQAVRAHDNRFDGLFFTCVSSTGIYCRPICPALLPKEEYCSFVATAAEAEKAGYRPCLRCRPERAPQTHTLDTLAHRTAAYIDDTLLADQTIAQLAQQQGVSDRQLRRVFLAEIGVEPLAYVTTRRLLFAKQLLQDTTLPILQVAYAAGFGSPDRLTAHMKRAYKLTPQQLRKTKTSPKTTSITIRTDYRPPFDWQGLLAFLGKRATPFEWVTEKSYHRMVQGREIIVRNVPTKNYLEIRIPLELAQSTHTILRKTRTLFDLDANPRAIEEALGKDLRMKQLLALYPGSRVPGTWDAFETLLRTIIGQQVSVAGAATIMRRFVEHIGATPDAVAASSPEAIANLGMPRRRAQTLWSVAALVQSGELSLTERDPAQFYAQLVAVPGIGPWTAEYLCMRVLHWPDAFPAGDLGLQKAAKPGTRLTERQLHQYAEQWRPWRSYATILLWKSLS